jgi:hypothetical protein
MYENRKARPVETVPRIGEGRIKENGGRGEFKTHGKHFCKCHSVPPVQQ